MSYAQQFVLVNDFDFNGRVAMSLVMTAQNVKNEAVDAHNRAKHDKRLILANQVLRDPMFTVSKFIYDIASNVAIAEAGPLNSLDGDLDYVIASNWDIKAGVSD